MNLSIQDGRAELWQWDTGVRLVMDEACEAVNISASTFGVTVDVTAAEDGKTWVAAVPDEMLQKPGDLICYAVQSTATGTITAAYRSFRVNRRPKPAGYVATPTEVRTWRELNDKKIDAPQTAAVGEVLTVEEVDAEGKPKKWKTAPGVNITTELTRESTDAQVPSAKAAYDAIEQKIDKNQGVESAGMILGVDEDGNVVPQNKPAQAIAGAAAPTTATAGVVGQEYYVITDGVVAEMYVCTAAANGTYAWNKVELGAEIDDTSTEQTKVWSAKKSNQLSQDVAKLKEKKAEIDDTAVGANAWSSQNIVDMLCPPIQESGNPVVCYPVAVYPLGVKAKWEPVQEGSGTPSPENIRPIKGRDSVTVTRCGENLLNFSVEKRVYGISITTESDGRYHLKGTLDRDGFVSNFGTVHLPAGTYTVKKVSFSTSLNTNAIVITLRRYTANNNTVSWIESTNDSGSRNTGSLDKPADIVLSFYGSRESIKEGTVIDTYLELVLVAGTTAPTTYTPYIGQTATLTLPETVYGGEVDAVTGTTESRYVFYEFNGTENFKVRNESQYSFSLKETSYKGICSHFPNIDNYALQAGTKGVYLSSTSIAIFNTSFTDVNEFKSYLRTQAEAGTPVQLCYTRLPNIANKFITATGAQPLPALAGANTVITDANSATITGRADPIKRITDLEDAVASQT